MFEIIIIMANDRSYRPSRRNVKCRCADVLVCRNARRLRTDMAMNQLPAANSYTNEPSDDTIRTASTTITTPTTLQPPAVLDAANTDQHSVPTTPTDQSTALYYLSLYHGLSDVVINALAFGPRGPGFASRTWHYSRPTR